MMVFLSRLSLSFIPVMLTVIIGHGLWKRQPVYDHFIVGAKEGIQTAADILPYIIAIFIGIEALVSSGAMSYLEQALSPFFNFFGIPEELTSLIILRPVSGSGSLVLVERMVTLYGADSFLGRAASIMAGSCETVFYVLAVYFGATAVKKIRHALLAGMVGYIIGVIASVWISR
ncbi:MAG: nucleoside recognition domain-containing protein [Eubacteriales bacterium]|nr:nucleoside recognition domain-containing protein [Eubacteriales bacterium]